MSIGFGWGHLFKQSSFFFCSCCLLVVLAFTESGVRFLQYQFSSVSSTSYKQTNHGIVNLCFLVSSSHLRSSSYLGLVGTSRLVLSDMPTWGCEIFLFHFPGSFSSCVDLNPYAALNCHKPQPCLGHPWQNIVSH